MVSRIPITPMGILTKKTARQPNAAVRIAPSTGPDAAATPPTLAHTPIALALLSWFHKMN